MYRLNEIADAFKGLVGWKPMNTNIDESVTSSESGLYFQEVNPLLTLRAMRGIMPEDMGAKYPAYAAGTAYDKDAIVQNGGKFYKSKVANNTAATTDAASWGEYDVLTDYLDELETCGVKKVITRFVRDKVIGLESKNIIDRRCLFDGVGNIRARVPNNGRIVGFELTPIRSAGVTTKLEKLGLQFVGNSGNVKMYLFHSSQVTPVWSQEFNFTNQNGSFMWFDLTDLYLTYVAPSHNAGGSWYLVYYQSALPDYMEAINFGRDWSREPCGNCNKGDAVLYQKMSQFIRLSPFYVVADSWDEALWDLDAMMYDNTNNYGINLMFSIGCDVTDFMIAERADFANAVQLQVAADALRALALNPEVSVNRVQYNADRDNILYETDGNGQAIKGIHGDLERAYKALSFDARGIDPVCLTCKSKGIKFGTI